MTDYSDSAMLALVPSADDAQRLAVPGYEPPEQLHVTLAFLGDADACAPHTDDLQALCEALAGDYSPMSLKAWATAHFNPDDEGGCAVYLIGGEEGSALDGLAEEAQAGCGEVHPDMPEQHEPYVSHLTAGYQLHPDELDQVGSDVLFDKLRLAIGNTNYDYPLTGEGDNNTADHETEQFDPMFGDGPQVTPELSEDDKQRALLRSQVHGDGMSYREWARGDLVSSLTRAEALLAFGKSSKGNTFVHDLKKGFDELLHPRGSDGQFIEKNGKVRGNFADAKGKKHPLADARTIGFKTDVNRPNDPWVLVQGRTPNGELVTGTAHASEIEKSNVKGRLSQRGKALPQDLPGVVNPDHPEFASPIQADAIETAQGQPGKAIHVTDVNEAVRLLGEGKKIELDQPDQVATLLDRLHEEVQAAKAAGNDAPNIDLCNVTVKGSNLFCVESAGVKRIDMPQLSGVPVPGSKADALPRNANGNVDLADEFRKYLASKGITITEGHSSASHLRASQDELNGAQVAALLHKMEDGTFTKESPIFISRDNYVVDGHHRWAADVGFGYHKGEDQQVATSKVDMSILDLLTEANKFTKEWGIQARSSDNRDIRGYTDRPGDRGAMSREQVDALTPDEVTEYINNATADIPRDDPQARASALDRILAGAFLSPLDTDSTHDKLGPDHNKWDEERTKLHDNMWNEIYSAVQSSGVPQERDALVLGGAPGAGKSSQLKPGGAADRFGVTAWTPGEDPSVPDGATHVSINPDAIKQLLIDRGGMPPGLDGIKPMEGVTFLHEESSYLSALWVQRLQDLGFNIVLDNTLEDAAKMRKKRLDPMAKSGYKFRGLFVDITPEESKASAARRYAQDFKTKLGGRFVSSAVQGDKPPLNGRKSVNRNAFDTLAGINPDGSVTGKGWFSDFIVVNNDGISTGNPAKEVVVEGTGLGTNPDLAPAPAGV